jgi:hypothetical protein
LLRVVWTPGSSTVTCDDVGVRVVVTVRSASVAEELREELRELDPLWLPLVDPLRELDPLRDPLWLPLVVPLRVLVPLRVPVCVRELVCELF